MIKKTKNKSFSDFFTIKETKKTDHNINTIFSHSYEL